MRQQRNENTGPEIVLRRVLHAMGLRFRLHAQIVPGTTRRVDIVFPTPRVCVQVYGCFWHGCGQHGQRPGVRNPDYWVPKIERNRMRDADTKQRLISGGWTLVEVWEHDDPLIAASRVAALVEMRTRALT
jgi:DNA mismatch endonuclease (patch repair protein)